MDEGLDRLKAGLGGPGIVPPVIDEHVEIVERADVVPPHIRDVERVARVQIGDQRGIERAVETWETIEIGIVEIDQADRRARGREFERTDMEVGDLIGRDKVKRRRPATTTAMFEHMS